MLNMVPDGESKQEMRATTARNRRRSSFFQTEQGSSTVDLRHCGYEIMDSSLGIGPRGRDWNRCTCQCLFFRTPCPRLSRNAMGNSPWHLGLFQGPSKGRRAPKQDREASRSGYKA